MLEANTTPLITATLVLLTILCIWWIIVEWFFKKPARNTGQFAPENDRADTGRLNRNQPDQNRAAVPHTKQPAHYQPAHSRPQHGRSHNDRGGQVKNGPVNKGQPDSDYPQTDQGQINKTGGIQSPATRSAALDTTGSTGRPSNSAGSPTSATSAQQPSVSNSARGQSAGDRTTAGTARHSTRQSNDGQRLSSGDKETQQKSAQSPDAKQQVSHLQPASNTSTGKPASRENTTHAANGTAQTAAIKSQPQSASGKRPPAPPSKYQTAAKNQSPSVRSEASIQIPPGKVVQPGKAQTGKSPTGKAQNATEHTAESKGNHPQQATLITDSKSPANTGSSTVTAVKAASTDISSASNKAKTDSALSKATSNTETTSPNAIKSDVSDRGTDQAQTGNHAPATINTGSGTVTAVKAASTDISSASNKAKTDSALSKATSNAETTSPKTIKSDVSDRGTDQAQTGNHAPATISTPAQNTNTKNTSAKNTNVISVAANRKVQSPDLKNAPKATVALHPAGNTSATGTAPSVAESTSNNSGLNSSRNSGGNSGQRRQSPIERAVAQRTGEHNTVARDVASISKAHSPNADTDTSADKPDAATSNPQDPVNAQEVNTPHADTTLRAQLARSEQRIKSLQSTLNNLQQNLPQTAVHNSAATDAQTDSQAARGHTRPALISKVRVLDAPRP